MNKIILLLLICHIGTSSCAQKSPDDICKIWYNGEKTVKIQIYKSGLKYFGKIIWLKEPKDESGNEKIDKNNPDVSKRGNKILGSLMLTNFAHEGVNTYENGQIYDGRNGKIYNCILTLETENRLKVRGYIGISLFGKTDIWTATIN
jgi:uncharacterized protein (DUF2147 family)